MAKIPWSEFFKVRFVPFSSDGLIILKSDEYYSIPVLPQSKSENYYRKVLLWAKLVPKVRCVLGRILARIDPDKLLTVADQEFREELIKICVECEEDEC